MTVCIAATSLVEGVIVTVSDTMLSTAVDSIETAAVKFATVATGSNPWVCMYSGDPTVFDTLYSHIKASLYGKSNVSHLTVIAAIEAAYEAVIEHRIEREILSPFGMKRKDFVEFGFEQFGPVIFQQVIDAIRQLTENLRYVDQTELLMCGFDEGGTPHILSADGIGHCTLHDGYGFHAIGVGSSAARGWLTTHNSFRTSDDVAEIAYRLCEAKFASESAPSVGPTTTILAVFSFDGYSDSMVIRQPDAGAPPPEPLDRMAQLMARRSSLPVLRPREVIREAWEARRKQELPSDALDAIRNGLSRIVPRMEQRKRAVEEIKATQPLQADPQQTEDREVKKDVL